MKIKVELDSLGKKILDDIESNGGKVYLVGGLIRDLVINGKSDYHDIDVEIFNMELNTLEAILSKYGDVKTVGKSFGILKVSTLKNYDFALPRIEAKTGKTHKDFDVTVDKDLSLQKASIRRDITINALMYEYSTREVLDFYHGLEDVKHHTIRLVNKDTFKEDPLRVLRVAQFASRLEFTVEPITLKECRTMVQQGMLKDLSNERIFEEYNKLLTSSRPSIGLKFLNEINALPRCLQALQHTRQRLDFHPEGNVLNHTILVVDLAALCKNKTSNPLGFMWGALLHDIGKPVVTSIEGHAPRHAEVGLDVFNEEMNRIIQGDDLKKYIKTMIKYHMRLSTMSRRNSSDYKYLVLLSKIKGVMPLNDLVLMTKCDKLGRLRDGHKDIEVLNSYLDDKINRLGDTALDPYISGEDLFELGVKQGPKFKELIDWSYDLQMRKHSKEDIIRMLKEEVENDK